jgi:hypothetical protein
VIEGLSPDAALRHLENLVMDLDKIFPEPSRDLLTRPLAIQVLEAVIEWMRPITDLDLDTLKTGERVVADHGAVALLVELVDALKDLDTPHRHPALKSNPIGSQRKLPRAQQKRRKALSDAVLMFQRINKLKHRKQAERGLAAFMRIKGVKFEEKLVTPKRLENLRRGLKINKKPISYSLILGRVM